MARGPRKGKDVTVTLSWGQHEGKPGLGQTGKGMPHAKHFEFNLKQADLFVSGSQTWPTAHQSLFQRKLLGPENEAVVGSVLLPLGKLQLRHPRGLRASLAPNQSLLGNLTDVCSCES